MKTIYIVTSCGFRPAVAFESEERAEAVRAMCGGSIDEVQVVDAELSAADMLVHVSNVVSGIEDSCRVCDGEGESDGDE